MVFNKNKVKNVFENGSIMKFEKKMYFTLIVYSINTKTQFIFYYRLYSYTK